MAITAVQPLYITTSATLQNQVCLYTKIFVLKNLKLFEFIQI